MIFNNKKINSCIYAFVTICFVVFSSCSKEVYTGINETMVGKNSRIIIQTKPTGATIYLDDKNMGLLSNDSLIWLNSGQHKVSLKLNLFPDKNIYFSLQDGDRQVYTYNYFTDPTNFGSITCTSKPSSAVIYLNDTLTGKKTPNTFNNLIPGLHKVKVTLTGCRSDSGYVTLSGGKNQTINFTLEDTTKWVSYNVNNSPMQSNYVSKVVVDKNNIKWVGTQNLGLGRYDGKNWEWFKQADSPLIYDFITSLAIDKNNNLWVGTSGGIMTFNGITWTNYSSILPRTGTYVRAIAIDKNNVVWIGTMDGLVSFNGTSSKIYTTNNSGLAGNFVTCISIDSQNRIWMGTNNFGISMFDGNSWKLFNMNNMNLTSNAGNSIQDITVDKNDDVWVAHIPDNIRGYTGGLTKFDGKNWSIQFNGYFTSLTEAIWVDANNNKWICTKNGLGKIDFANSMTTFTTTNSQIPVSQVESVVIDQGGDLYVGTFGGGLGKLKKGNF